MSGRYEIGMGLVPILEIARVPVSLFAGRNVAMEDAGQILTITTYEIQPTDGILPYRTALPLC